MNNTRCNTRLVINKGETRLERSKSPIRFIRGMSDDDDIHKKISDFKTKFEKKGEFNVIEYFDLLKRNESFMMSDFTNNPLLPKFNYKCNEYRELFMLCLSKGNDIYKRFFYEQQ